VRVGFTLICVSLPQALPSPTAGLYLLSLRGTALPRHLVREADIGRAALLTVKRYPDDTMLDSAERLPALVQRSRQSRENISTFGCASQATGGAVIPEGRRSHTATRY
jgi:hypothetical protein